MAKRKHLPSNRHKGLYVYCSTSGCKRHFSWTRRTVDIDAKQVKEEAICKLSGGKYSNCKHFENHRFKSRLHIPGTSHGVRSKTYEATTYQEAVIEAVEFENEFKGIVNPLESSISISNRHYLFETQKKYILYLENVDVPEHRKVERSQLHIDEAVYCLKLFNESLKMNKINKRITLINRIDDKHVGYFHKYLLEEKGYKNATYNNKMSAVKSFFNWAIKEHKLLMKNPFEGVKRRTVIVNKQTITGEEFKALLKIISPINGSVIEGKKGTTKKNRYKPYLKDGIELALHTGGRREEVVGLRWNMIKEVNNEPTYIVVSNLKVERQKGEGYNDNVAPKIIPITKSLKRLLLRMGYTKNKTSTAYILAPDRAGTSMTAIMVNISKGFSHFYKQLNTGRELTFKCLRKTYLTHLNATLSGDTKKLSSHASDQVLHKHYIDERVVNKAIKELEIFSS